MNDLDRYAVSLENMEVLRAQVEEQAREIERLKEGQDSLILVRDDYKSQVNEYRELWAKAAIKAKPSVVAGMLRDTLELWLADYEDVASNPDFEPFPHVADLAAKTRDALDEVARLNQPASAGDERVTLSAFTAWGESVGLRPALQTVGELKAFKAGAEWKVRAALSAPSHGEQVRGLPECVRAWFEAKKAHVKAVGDYNARLAFVKQHMPFGTSVDPEYQIMEAADRKVRDLVWPMFVGLMEIDAPSAGSHKEQG